MSPTQYVSGLVNLTRGSTGSGLRRQLMEYGKPRIERTSLFGQFKRRLQDLVQASEPVDVKGQQPRLGATT